MEPLLWVAVPMLLLAAGMLVDVGDDGLWIAVFALGVALVAVGLFRSRRA